MNDRHTNGISDDELRDLIRVMDEPAPVPDRFLQNLWNDLGHTIDDAQHATPLGEHAAPPSVPIIDQSPTKPDEPPPILWANDVPSRERSWRFWPVMVGAAAAVCVVVGLVLFAFDSADDSLATEGFTGTTSTPSSSLPDQRIVDEPDALLISPPAFATPVQVGQIGTSFLRVDFTSVADSAYTAVVKTGDEIVDTVSGSAAAGEPVLVTVRDLTAGTLYSVQVTLIGPPTATSSLIEIRTAGATDGSSGPGETLELQNLRVTTVSPTEFQVDYDTNICANGSFVIFEENGREVGRNGGQLEGCTTQHLAVPGKWTDPLQPDTTYVITVTVEANGAGLGEGNIDSQSLTVTTTVLADEPVEFVDLQLVDVGPTHFQVDYRSNVCANGSFVVTKDGEEVGRNDGLPSGCGTEHLAMPGQWTPELEPATAYVITVTLEANGAGLGDGNTVTESLDVLTADS